MTTLTNKQTPYLPPDALEPVSDELPVISLDHCPHLGVADDPDVRFGFASTGNYCHHVSPPQAINLAHQSGVCLSKGCVDCPVYQEGWIGPLPRAISAEAHSSRHGLLYWTTLALIVGAIVLALWYASTLIFARGLPFKAEAHSDPQVAVPAQGNLPVTGNQPSQVLLLAPRVDLTSSPTPFAPTQPAAVVAPVQPTTEGPPPSPSAPPASPTSPPAQQSATCQPPANWMRYSVRPGDSLTLLSRLSGAGLAEIKAANCLKKSSFIFVGQQLYVPHFSVPSYYSSPSSGSSPSSASPGRSDPAPIPPPDR